MAQDFTPSGSLSLGSTVKENTDIVEKRCAMKRGFAMERSSCTLNGRKRRRIMLSRLGEAPKADPMSASSVTPLTTIPASSMSSQHKAATSPMLIHKSASKFFRGHDLTGSQLLSGTAVNVTFDMKQFVAGVGGHGSTASRTKAQRLNRFFDVVFVDWHRVSAALTDLQFMVSAIEDNQDIVIPSTIRKIIFLDWRALKLFNGTNVVPLTPFKRYVIAYMLYENGEVQSVVYGKIDWTHLLCRESG